MKFCKYIICAACQFLNSWTINFNMMVVVTGAWLQHQRAEIQALSLTLSLTFMFYSGIWLYQNLENMRTFNNHLSCDCLNLISCWIYLYKNIETENYLYIYTLIFCVLFCFFCFEWLEIKDTWAALQQLRFKNGRKKRNNICLVPLLKQQLAKGHFAVRRLH